MITKNSSGTSLSANYDTIVAEAPREWQAQLYVNSSLLSCSIKKIIITKGSCGSAESFSVGNVYSSMLTAELLELATDVKGEDIEVRIGLNTGSMEWVTVGWFTAIEVTKTVYSTSITAYGFSTTKTSGTFTIPATLSLANVGSAIETATGRTVTFDTGINTAYVLAGTLEAGLSCYQGLQVLAHACGGYVTDTYDGNFAIHQFSDTPTLSVSTDRMRSLPNVEELPFAVTGVQVTASGQYVYTLTQDVAIDNTKTYYKRSGTAPNYVYTEVLDPKVSEIGTYYERHEIVYTYGSPIVLYDSNGNMSAGVFNVFKGLVGYSYYTGTIDLTIGDPRIEGDDVLAVTDVDGNTYAVPCHRVVHTYDGGLSTSIQAVKATSEGDGLVTVAPISQQLDLISQATALAQASSERAFHYAEQAEQSASRAEELATIANDILNEMEESAIEAGTTLTQIYQDAEDAKTQSGVANAYANSALEQLNIVQDVVGVLDLLSTNATYQQTQDASVVAGKWYFTRSGTSPDYVYTVVPNPVDADLSTYYEMVSIDESVQDYLVSRLSVTGDGMWIQDPTMQTKILLSATDGVVLYGTNGTIVGKYGSTAQIGDAGGFHIEMDGTELGFYQGTRKVAYISNNQLYITQSVVLQQMDVGTPMVNGKGGQWSWKVHANIIGQNNYYLKWLG